MRSVLLMLGGIVVYDAVSWVLAVFVGAWQLYAVAVTVLGIGVVALIALWLARRGRGAWAVSITAAAFLGTLIRNNFV